jgi:hypothetical protein
MSDGYEYKQIDIKNDVDAVLQQFGDEGWEVIEIPRSFLTDNWMRLKRPLSSPSEPSTWEYRSFRTDGVPTEWWDHIRSFGWIILEPPYIESERHTYYRRVHLAKRPGVLKGSDDGDVIRRLQDFVPSFSPRDISNVLKIKWNMSQQRSQDVGTDVAVMHWLTHDVLQRLLEGSGILHSNASLESVLDELLSLRESLRERGQPFHLDAALVRRWQQESAGKKKSSGASS